MKKHKLAFVCGSKAWGGLEINQFNACCWFSERGYDTLLFCKKDSEIEKRAKDKQLPVEYLKEHRRYKYFFAGLYFSKLIREHRITHLICRDSKDLNICSIAKSFAFQKFFLTYIMEMQLGVSKKNFLHTARYLKIDAWICLLPYLKKQVLEKTKFPENRIFILPSAIEIEQFTLSKEQLKEKYALSLNSFIFGILGRIDPLKGQEEAINAFNLLPDLSFILLIVGSPTLNEHSEYFEQIQQLIEKSNLNFKNKKIYYFPHVEKINEIFPLFDVSLVCSKSETFGMVTIESLAFGIPVIGTQSGGTPELLDNGKYGLLYTPGNIEQLKDRMLQMYQNHPFDANQLKKYSTNFEKNHILNLFEKILFKNEK
ncbi:MAG: glycosyltransferase [Flavobacteriia bacterium]|nr:glycosyltransferase [Flavobacteriia bacterium]